MMEKSLTGISGFDAITAGGLPSGRATLVEGEAGSGKSIFALQSLVHGARTLQEPGIFVCFEENSRQVIANASSFDWDLDELDRDRLFFLDAQPDPDLIRSGEFDIAGMLAILDTRVNALGAKRIVFDAIDVVLALMNDMAAVRREVYRLHDWLLRLGLTAIITSKTVRGDRESAGLLPLDFMEFMVDCSVSLEHVVTEGVSQRYLRVSKYRGSAFEANQIPMMIGSTGIEIAQTRYRGIPSESASNERISSGIEEVDHMLGGGFFRAASILITGLPGTAKTTMSGAFAAAACERGEKTLFVSFDSREDEIIRNLESVAISLQQWVDSRFLQLVSMRALNGSAESSLLRIRSLAREHGARVLIIDPLSALSKSGNRATAPGVAERLIDWVKTENMSVMCTSLLDETGDSTPTTPLEISTIADTWIHLSYVVHAGERNRGFSIIKSRGTSHSNQVRELVLSNEGITVADVYTAGGEVLMGSMRWAKEREAQVLEGEKRSEVERNRARLHSEAAELEARIRLLRGQLEAKQDEEEFLLRTASDRSQDVEDTRSRLHQRRRSSDANVPHPGKDDGD
jgi:circadian clock protein KaiC